MSLRMNLRIQPCLLSWWVGSRLEQAERRSTNWWAGRTLITITSGIGFSAVSISMAPLTPMLIVATGKSVIFIPLISLGTLVSLPSTKTHSKIGHTLDRAQSITTLSAPCSRNASSNAQSNETTLLTMPRRTMHSGMAAPPLTSTTAYTMVPASLSKVASIIQNSSCQWHQVAMELTLAWVLSPLSWRSQH